MTEAEYGLGCLTELMVSGLEGAHLHRPHYRVGRWPQLPTYRGGNLLAFRTAPTRQNLHQWDAWFAEEFSALPEVTHRNFAWSVEHHGWGDAEQMGQEDYELERTLVFAGSSITTPPHAHRGLDVRPILGANAWKEATQGQMEAAGAGPPSPQSVEFHNRIMQRYRALSYASRGGWFGAYSGSTLQASCGLFFAELETARFQSVVTRRDSRGQGVASALVAAVANFALKELGVKRVVITASANSTAERVYRSLGLPQVDEMGTLLKPRVVPSQPDNHP